MYKNKVRHCWHKFFVEFGQNLHCLPMFHKRVLDIKGFRGWRRETGLSPPVNILLTVPRRYFFCRSFMGFFCLVFAMPLCASIYMCLVVTCWERADLLTLVCGV